MPGLTYGPCLHKQLPHKLLIGLQFGHGVAGSTAVRLRAAERRRAEAQRLGQGLQPTARGGSCTARHCSCLTLPVCCPGRHNRLSYTSWHYAAAGSPAPVQRAHLRVDVSHIARCLLVAVLCVHANQVGAGRRRNASTCHRHGCCCSSRRYRSRMANGLWQVRAAAAVGGGGEQAGGGSSPAALQSGPAEAQRGGRGRTAGARSPAQGRRPAPMGPSGRCRNPLSLPLPAQTVASGCPCEPATLRPSLLGHAAQGCPARFT